MGIKSYSPYTPSRRHMTGSDEVGKPYSVKRILTQDGTIGMYYSNRIQWSPDGSHLFVFKRIPVEKRYAYYVESSPAWTFPSTLPTLWWH